MQTINFIDEKIQDNQAQIATLQNEVIELEKQKANQKNGIESWLGFQFESSSSLTEEFAQFYKDIKKYRIHADFLF